MSDFGNHRSKDRSGQLALRGRAAALVLAALAMALPAVAADAPVRVLARDVACTADAAETAAGGARLDLYGPAAPGGPPRPVVLFVHGGGWRNGDKAHVWAKPAAFVAHGCLFASAGYRLAAPATPRDQGADVAAAVAWLRDHAREHGGDGNSIFLVGHSAGAHLAALVGTDERLLGHHGLAPADLGGVVLLDGAGYDMPRQMAAARLPRMKELYRDAFGDDPEAQRDASSITHVAPGKRYPPFLIFHVGQRLDSRQQSEALAERLRTAGGAATTVHEPDKNHLTLNRELGTAGDGPTAKVLAFLDECRASRAAAGH